MTANAFPALLMPVILLYCIYGGVTTPTEAAAVAAFYALLLAALLYRALSLRALFGGGRAGYRRRACPERHRHPREQSTHDVGCAGWA